MLKRVVSLALVAAALPAASAHAATSMFVIADPAAADVVIAFDDAETPVAVEVVRGGTTVTASEEGIAELEDLQVGDTITATVDGAVTARLVYDGLPAITAPVCVGHTTFTGRRGADATVALAGTDTAFEDTATWTAGETFTVTLPTPIAAQDSVFVGTTVTAGDATIVSARTQAAVLCPDSPPQPPEAPEEPPAEAPEPPTGTPPAVDLSATLAGLKARGLRTLARRARTALAFAFPQPGTVALKLTAKGKRIGAGTRTLTRSGSARVTLKLTRAGRKLLARSRKLKVTLHATFTAAGAEPQRASASVTLRRR